MEMRSVEAAGGWIWLSCGWQVFRQNPLIWVVLFVVYVAVALVLSLIPLIGSLANTLLSPALAGGLFYGARELDQGRELRVGHLFRAFQEGELLKPMLVLGLISLAGMLVALVLGGGLVAGSVMSAQMHGVTGPDALLTGAAMGGLLILTLAGLAVTMALVYAVPLTMLSRVSPGEAVKLSFSACLSNWLPLLILGLIYLVLAFLAMIPFGLGLLVLGPVMVASLYCSYGAVFPELASFEPAFPEERA